MKKPRKRELNEAQTAARDERRARFSELAKKIAAMKPEERAELAARLPGLVSITGRPFSPFNSCLVMFQRPDATICGGFRQWLASGRAVRKGEHGFQIWVPCGGGAVDGEVVGGTDTQAAAEVQSERPRFIGGTIFDISQTEEVQVETEVS